MRQRARSTRTSSLWLLGFAWVRISALCTCVVVRILFYGRKDKVHTPLPSLRHAKIVKRKTLQKS